MGRRVVAAVRAVARCSPSTPMARFLRPCIGSQEPTPEMHLQQEIYCRSTPTKKVRLPDGFYRATPFMVRRVVAAVRPLERSSPSTPWALFLLDAIPISAATELICLPE